MATNRLFIFFVFLNVSLLNAQNSYNFSSSGIIYNDNNSIDWKEPKIELGLGAVLKHHYGFAAPRLHLGATNLFLKNRVGIYYILEYRPNIDFPEDQTNYYFRDILGLNYSINRSFTLHSGLGFFQRGILYSGNYRGGERFYGGLQIGKLRKEIGLTYNIPTNPMFIDFSYSGWVGPTFTLGYRSNLNSSWRILKSQKSTYYNDYNDSTVLSGTNSMRTEKKVFDTNVNQKEINSTIADKNNPLIKNQVDSIRLEQNNIVPQSKIVTSKNKRKHQNTDLIISIPQNQADSVKINPQKRNEKYKLYTFNKDGSNVKTSRAVWGSKTKIRWQDNKTIRKIEHNCILYYPVDIDTINQIQKDTLVQLINFMKNYPQSQLILIGNTDNSGTTDYNFKLSEARATIVKMYLINQGIAENRLEIRINGETKALGETEPEKAKNRCVEFQIIIP